MVKCADAEWSARDAQLSAEVVPHVPESKRELGFLKGRVDVPDEALFADDPEIERMFHGEDGSETQPVP